jgi:putative phosphoribosyl transferase
MEVHMIVEEIVQREVKIPVDNVALDGELILPPGATGVVLFAHGSGSSRHSPRNQFVAGVIRRSGLGTLLFDLLTPDEESADIYTRHLRFDIGMLARRLVAAANWLKTMRETRDLKLGFFGASTGGAAALVAAAELGETVGAVVSRGGRPDLAGAALPRVMSPVLLIVGGLDSQVITLNRQAYALLRCEKEMKIVPGATHLFEEPGTLETVADLAAEWFRDHLKMREVKRR